MYGSFIFTYSVIWSISPYFLYFITHFQQLKQWSNISSVMVNRFFRLQQFSKSSSFLLSLLLLLNKGAPLGKRNHCRTFHNWIFLTIFIPCMSSFSARKLIKNMILNIMAYLLCSCVLVLDYIHSFRINLNLHIFLGDIPLYILKKYENMLYSTCWLFHIFISVPPRYFCLSSVSFSLI